MSPFVDMYKPGYGSQVSKVGQKISPKGQIIGRILNRMHFFKSTFVLLTCICEACKSMVIIWSAPDTDNMLATNLAEIGARLCNKNVSLQSHGKSKLASIACN